MAGRQSLLRQSGWMWRQMMIDGRTGYRKFKFSKERFYLKKKNIYNSDRRACAGGSLAPSACLDIMNF